ncbi:CDP-alcohol phosphatidyltransferase family protein [Piscinibacter koreensis]|uniref:CDP-alcohol phosphatidyltransferase family protein n=1 Tax=Piscinibacter koreensis TaxID=2742824 RepID=A0A7Y6NL62_9BURK|nr:CDP-alcohol phosphatidyltransferase family protein [Schlegelella koreensis]NUZ05228.1 CDP-alcohol phosphatidyltransferase family protein [Schlegelella koreensis]
MNLWIDTASAASAECLFGVAPLERLRLTAGKVKGIDAVTLSGPDAGAARWLGARGDSSGAPLGTRLRAALVTSPGGIVAVDGANAVDPRLVGYLAGRAAPCVAARGEGAQRAVVLRLDPPLADAIPPDARDLREVADALLAAGRIAPLAEADFPAYVDKLRRSLPYWIYAVDGAATRRRLERQMFWDNYKGSTDLLTRYVYPPLVWPLVRLCIRLGIHPNAVTLLSVVLTFAAVPLFARGDFLLGFVCAYGMSVLDSVDGKLARVTLTDSKIGNVLDHGLDQVHPPFWYFAWAWGLGARAWADPLYQAAVWLIVFYFADRIVLAIAKRRIGFALHAATKLDGRVRSFIARRNITMTIMAFALLVGAGPAGFYLITAWQGLTFAWHSARTIWLGFLARGRARPEF